MDVKEYEEAKNKADVEWKGQNARFQSEMMGWRQKIETGQEEKRRATELLKGWDDLMQNLADAGTPMDTKRSAGKREKLEKAVKDAEEKVIDLTQQAEKALQPSLMKANEAKKVLDEKLRLYEAAKIYAED